MVSQPLSAAQLLLKHLQSHRTVIASVESCTGGMIADQITHIPGASENFWGAWIVYDNSAKTALGVPAQVISKQGAVSRETAQSLAKNGLIQLSKTLHESTPELIALQRPWNTLAVISTTGIAGPGGGTPDKPVGLCYIGIAIANATRSDSPVVKCLEVQAPAGNSRIEYKAYFTEQALKFLLASLGE